MSTQVVATTTPLSSPPVAGAYRETWWWWIATIASRAYLAFLMTLAVTAIAPALSSWDSFVIRSGSMAPTIVAGDVVVTSPTAGHPVLVGQVIAFHDLDRLEPDGSQETVIHRVVADLGDGAYTTAGDANRSSDRTPVTLETMIGQARVLVPFAGWPSLWAMSGDVVALAIWMLVTLVAMVVVALTPKWGPDGDQPDRVPPSAAENDRPPAGVRATTWRDVVWQKRYALARAGVAAVAVLTASSLGLRIAAASFTATTTNAGSDWAVAAGLGAADFQSNLVNGTSGGSVSWNGGTVTLKKVASVLSYSSLTNVRVSSTGSMASSPTGYGVWTRASESSKKISGYVFQLDSSSQKRFELVWWSSGNEKATPWATAPFPTGFNASLPHTIVVTTRAGTLTANVDGTTVLTSTLPTASVKVGSITYTVPTGGRFGFITWSSTTANLSGIQAVVAP